MPGIIRQIVNSPAPAAGVKRQIVAAPSPFDALLATPEEERADTVVGFDENGDLALLPYTPPAP